MHILQAQVWSSALACTQGSHIKKRNEKLMMHQKVSQTKQVEIGQFRNLAQKLNEMAIIIF